MLIPGEQLRRELATVPAFARFIAIEDREDVDPALVVKASSLTLKALLRDGVLTIRLGELSALGPGIYGVEIDEGDVAPSFAWSIVSSIGELGVIRRFVETRECAVHLFNELGVNVASAYRIDFAIAGALAGGFLNEQGNVSDEDVEAWLSRYERLASITAMPKKRIGWSEMKAAYYTDAGQVVRLHALTGEEGAFQEHLILWMSEYLFVKPVHGPQLVRDRKRREFTDVVFSSSQTAFLIESKALALLAQPVSRAQMKRRIGKSAKAAIRQLAGACGRLRSGSTIEDHNGTPLELPRDGVPQAIVLVPDLALLENAEMYLEACVRFAREERAMLHFLDSEELMSLVKDASYLSAHSKATMPVDAFDALLAKRYKDMLAQSDVRIRFRVRFVDDEAADRNDGD